MTYRVFSGPKGTGEISPTDKEKMLFKELGTLDDALSWTRHLQETGRVPLLLEGDDGTRMSRRQIGEALGVGRREQVGSRAKARANGEGWLPLKAGSQL